MVSTLTTLTRIFSSRLGRLRRASVGAMDEAKWFTKCEQKCVQKITQKVCAKYRQKFEADHIDGWSLEYDVNVEFFVMP